MISPGVKYAHNFNISRLGIAATRPGSRSASTCLRISEYLVILPDDLEEPIDLWMATSSSGW
jgi:hypothetical protein